MKEPTFRSEKFNLIYEDCEGKEVRARRRSDIRGHQLEDGTLVSHSKMMADYTYIGIDGVSKDRDKIAYSSFARQQK